MKLILESKHLLAWEKPAGIDSAPRSPEPDREPGGPHAVSIAVSCFPELQSIETHPNKGECGLLHRLDRATSGILLFARTQEAYDELRDSWNSPKVEKRYLALVSSQLNPFPELPRDLRFPIAHHFRSAKKMVADAPSLDPEKEKIFRYRGNPMEAWTQIESCEPLKSPIYQLKIRLFTGKRHQIRVHLASIGIPILGDALYGGGAYEKGIALFSHEIKILGAKFLKEPLWIQATPTWSLNSFSYY